MILVGVSAVLAFFYLTSLDPVYRVETKLNEVQESTVSLQDSALSNLFSVQESSKNFDMFFWQLNSSQVAKKSFGMRVLIKFTIVLRMMRKMIFIDTIPHLGKVLIILYLTWNQNVHTITMI